MKNKLVIIGNGFDLAHRLKTSYADFLNWLLDKILMNQSLQSEFFSIPFDNSTEKLNILKGANSSNTSTSEFFREIIKDYNDKNWVDIESIYFSMLIKYFKSFNQGSNSNDLKTLTKYVQKLNKDFDIIKIELEDYLKLIKFQNNAYRDDFITLFRDSLCSKSSDKNEETLFLNFNYTNTLNLYKELIDKGNNNVLHIHGKLIDEKNPIIFGYGDEMNPYHQQIVDLNVNELFTHYKSFKYAQTENYHQLLLFLEKPFDVYILGHSCGLSDRVLFSTIFNTVNCEKIYPFYYEYDKGKDDFTEKTYELSRHFNNTSDFREKVQPKTKCIKL